MNIFITVYHGVRDVLTFPMRMFQKFHRRKLEKEVEEEQKQREKRRTEEIELETEKNSPSNSQEEVDIPTEKPAQITFHYEVVNSFGQTIKSSFDAATESEVRTFLINEGYKIISITPAKGINWNIELGSKKLKTSELSFALAQLSTYIRAGIPLIDSVRILAKQTVHASKRKVYEKIVYDLVTGEDFSKALQNQSDVFPRLLINMVKTAEMTGDLPTVLDEMSEYYESIEKTKKQIISAMIYPMMILLVSIAVVIFCLMFVVPSFVSMYEASNTALPTITMITLAMSNFVRHYYYILILVVVFIAVTYYLSYKNIKAFRKTMQSIFMKIPVLGNIIIYSEVSMFTRTFASLINHNVNITQSMDVLSKISNNEIYKEIINHSMETLQKGGKISESFRGNWAFPVVAYEMLVTGEETGQLGLMMEKVSEHYDSLHKTAIGAVKSLIEPITIIILAFAVGFILLSMFIPMFDVYNTIT